MRGFMSLAKSNTEKGYRGLKFRELVELANPDVQGIPVLYCRRSTQRLLSTLTFLEDATALTDRSNTQQGNNKLGGADAMHETFDPKVLFII